MKTITFPLKSGPSQVGGQHLKHRFVCTYIAGMLATQLVQSASAQAAWALITDDRSIQTKGNGNSVSAEFGQLFGAALDVPDYFYDRHAADMHASQFSSITSSKITGEGFAGIDHISDPAISSTAKSTLRFTFNVTHPGSYAFKASCLGGHLEDYAQFRTSSGKVLGKVSLAGNTLVSGTLAPGTYHLEAGCYAKDVSAWYSGSWSFALTLTPSVGSLTFHRTGLGNSATLACVGTPGTTCAVQRATTLNGPWETVNTIAVPSDSDGSFSFEDTNAPAASAFYRMLEQ